MKRRLIGMVIAGAALAVILAGCGGTHDMADMGDMDDMGMATPAIVGNRLLIRTSARIYCVQSK